MELLLQAYILLAGLAVGSFLNVVIYRVPLGLSPAKGFSFCPRCIHRLRAADLLPVVSFLLLGGRCRYCKEKISWRYPLVELLNALCWLAVCQVYGLTLTGFCYMVACSCLVAVAGIDLDHGIIPDRFNLIIGGLGLLLAVFTQQPTWLDRAIGFAAVSLPLLVVAMVTGGMGEGDIKLFAACGLLAGWKLTLLAFLFASVLAAVIGGGLLALGRANRKTPIPFGPFISLGVILTLLAGEPLIRWYLSLLGL